jgi:hypothetical protein
VAGRRTHYWREVCVDRHEQGQPEHVHPAAADQVAERLTLAGDQISMITRFDNSVFPPLRAAALAAGLTRPARCAISGFGPG